MSLSLLLGFLSILALIVTFAREVLKTDRKDGRAWKATVLLGLALIVLNGSVELGHRAVETSRDEREAARALEERAARSELRETLEELQREMATAGKNVERLTRSLPPKSIAQLEAGTQALQRQVGALVRAEKADSADLKSPARLHQSIEEIRVAVQALNASAIEAGRSQKGITESAPDQAMPSTLSGRASSAGEAGAGNNFRAETVPTATAASPAGTILNSAAETTRAESERGTGFSGTSRSRRLVGVTGASRSLGVGYLDLARPIDLFKGDRLLLKIEGGARYVVVRVLPRGWDSSKPDIILSDKLAVRADRTVDVALTSDYKDIVQISVFGGEKPWGLYDLGPGNGPATFVRVDLIR